jgi:peroxiredoxin
MRNQSNLISVKLTVFFAILSLIVTTAIFAESTAESNKPDSTSRPVETLLKARAEQSSQKTPDDFKAASRQGLEELVRSGIAKTALNFGDKMPAFELPDAHGKTVSSDDLLADGALVIVFYRGAWCPYCNLYLHALQDYLPEFESLGASMVAISGEPPDRSLEVEQKDSLTYPVLSDTALIASRQFGIVYEVPQVIQKVMTDRGFDLKTYYGTDKAELPLSATYVVNRNGKIIYAFLDPDYKLRAEPADIIAALKKNK